jgi:electron transport complex protein RnfG
MKRFIKTITSNDIARMIFALTMVGVFSGLTLVFIYKYSIPRIKINMNADTDRAIKELFPRAAKARKINDTLYKMYDNSGELLGYAFITEGKGYQGIIKMIAGVDSSVRVMEGIEILESQETPGLGAEINNPPFKKQFRGLSLSHKIEYVKNEKPDKPYEIQAITGATISSRAVVNILNKGIAVLKKDTSG